MARLPESQGKQILAAAGISVPRGEVARTSAEARAVAERLGGAGGGEGTGLDDLPSRPGA